MNLSSKTILGFATLIIGLSLGGIGFWLLFGPAEYQAVVRLKIDVDDPNSYNPYFIQTEFETIQSEIILNKVVGTLNLDVQWCGRDPGDNKRKTASAVTILRRRMRVQLIPNSKWVEIYVTDETPDEAARIANAIAQTYHDFRIERYRQQKVQGLTIMKDEYRKEEASLKTKQEIVAQLRKQLNFTNPEPATAVPASNYPAYFQAERELTNEETIHRLRQTIMIEIGKSIDHTPGSTFVAIVNPAIPPKHPIGPNRLLGATLLVCGLAIAVFGFYLLSVPGSATKA
jgi:hypothetical protein